MADRRINYSCILLSMLVLASCALPTQNVQMATTESTAKPFAQTEIATLILSTPTNTVFEVTITPHPTVDPSESTDFIDKIASTDEICLFPCWAGISPGETNWSNTQSFLESFSNVRKHSPSSPKGFAVDVPLPDQYQDDILWISIFLDEKNVIRYIKGWRYNLFVENLFRTYGRPENIYLYVLGVLPSDNLEEFKLLFSYKSQGFFLVYAGQISNQSLLDICPSSSNERSHFWLWNPEDNEAMDTIVNGRSKYYFYGDWSQYQEISIATKGEVTLDSFYETYTNPANVDVCFQVPSPSFP